MDCGIAGAAQRAFLRNFFEGLGSIQVISNKSAWERRRSCQSGCLALCGWNTWTSVRLPSSTSRQA